MALYEKTLTTKKKVFGTYNKYIKSFIGGNREFSSIKFDDIQRDLNSMVDIVIGFRADDSYFAFANDFVNNSLSLSDLKEAMMLGKLGEQIVLKSKRAFDAINILEPIPADCSEYYAKYFERDNQARAQYKEIASHAFSQNEVYVIDLIRNNIK